MANGAWFNHYDDPNEFWDDEPLQPRSPTRPPTPTPHRPAPPAPPVSTSGAVPRGRPAAVPSLRPSTPAPIGGGDSASTDELLDKTFKFHARMAQSRRLLDSVAPTGPRTAVGHDPTKCVSVTVGVRDEFLRAHINDQWDKRLDPSQLGQAVIDAAHDARRARSIDTTIDPAVLQRLRARSVDDPPSAPISTPANVGDSERIRSALHLAGEMLDLAATASVPSDTDIGGHGAGADGWVRAAVNSTGALVGCDVAAYWAAGRGGAEIADAVDEAVADALRDLATKPAAADPITRANRLIADGLAYLSNPNRQEG